MSVANEPSAHSLFCLLISSDSPTPRLSDSFGFFPFILSPFPFLYFRLLPFAFFPSLVFSLKPLASFLIHDSAFIIHHFLSSPVAPGVLFDEDYCNVPYFPREDGATICLTHKGNHKQTVGVNFRAAEAISAYIRQAELTSGALFRPRLNPRSKKLGGGYMHAATMHKRKRDKKSVAYRSEPCWLTNRST
jgi:hypothetical protein